MTETIANSATLSSSKQGPDDNVPCTPLRVAVISVHGVGDQRPGETARAIAHLLERGPLASQTVQYEKFEESSIDLPVTLPVKGSLSNSDDVDVDFSLRSLNQLDQSDELAYYRTTKLTGSRLDTNTKLQIDVDVFEMHWADLSRAPGFVFKFLAELYQLFFHLASLGRKTVQFAGIQAEQEGASRGTVWFLRLIGMVHQSIQFLLAGAIPIFNLFLLVPVAALTIVFMPSTVDQQLVVQALCALSAFVVAIAIFYRSGVRYGAFLSAAIAAASWLTIYYINPDAQLIIGCWAILAALVFAWWSSRALLDRYQDWIGKFIPLTVSILVAIYFAVPINRFGLGSFDALLLVATDVAGWLFVILQWMWRVLAVLLFCACISPLAAHLAGFEAPLRAAVRTGRVGALLSATLFFVTTAVLWASFLHQIQKPLESHNLRIDLVWPLLNQETICPRTNEPNLVYFADCLFRLTTGNYANFFLVLVSAALLLAAGALLPSIWYEAASPNATRATSVGRARELWDWLDMGARVLWVAEILIIFAWVALAIGSAPNLFEPWWSDGTSNHYYSGWVASAGAFFAVALPLTVLFRDQIPNGLSAVLDTALDVSSWLRERPYSHNPRGRILCRYLALLREISQPNAYQRLVIISHSQGTVITADLLRLLKSPQRTRLFSRQLPQTRLLTAGSPLRQLYASRFSTLYGWLNGLNCDVLGVQSWINVYRCGDYIGRDLWKGGSSGYNLGTPQRALKIDAAHANEDYSLGLGAHTHYFDSTAPDVAILIDRLIAS